jgi:hypothetical protein
MELSPRAVQESFETIWEPANRLSADLSDLPLGMLRIWQDSAQGHVVFTHRASGYRPGPQPWHDTTLESVCYFSLVDLHHHERGGMLALLNLLDHLWGSDAAQGDPWLSDGAGLTPRLREVATRFQKINALGYGHEELGVNTPHDYLAHTLWLYRHDPQRLNVIDPLVFKLYHGTLMQEAFWSAE